MTLRDTLLNKIYEEMQKDKNVFFITADFGSPIVDKIKKLPNFINVGIAEQNLINISVGLALEGFKVYTYVIAPFLLRAFEQIRINIALMSEFKNLNINIIGVGSGISYNMSGATHHSLEDLGVFNTLPNLEIFTPSENYLVNKYFKNTLQSYPKYIRLDAKVLPDIETKYSKNGFRVLKDGDKFVISYGYMLHKLLKFDIGIIDIYNTNFNQKKLKEILKNKEVIVFEESFSPVIGELIEKTIKRYVKKLYFNKKYVFKNKDREEVYKEYGFDDENLRRIIENS